MEEEQEIETLEPFYNCSECSSPIEIISLDNINIKFKCYNKKNSHEIKMTINEYLNKMKIMVILIVEAGIFFQTFFKILGGGYDKIFNFSKFLKKLYK